MKTAAVVALGVVLLATSARAADVSGDWEFATKVFDDVSYARVTLKADGEKLSGSLNELKLEGTIKGDDLTFTATRPNGQRFGEFKGRANGDELKGTVSGPGIPAARRHGLAGAPGKRPATPTSPRLRAHGLSSRLLRRDSPGPASVPGRHA